MKAFTVGKVFNTSASLDIHSLTRECRVALQHKAPHPQSLVSATVAVTLPLSQPYHAICERRAVTPLTQGGLVPGLWESLDFKHLLIVCVDRHNMVGGSDIIRVDQDVQVRPFEAPGDAFLITRKIAGAPLFRNITRMACKDGATPGWVDVLIVKI